jgi:hypothetical protein
MDTVFSIKEMFDIASDEHKNVPVLEKNDQTGMHVKLFFLRKSIVIRFAPYETEDIIESLMIGSNIILNQDLIPVKNGMMNRCFYKLAAKSIPFIKLFIQTQKTVYITGISLGAAIGQCLYYQLRELHPDLNIFVYSFASPRVGDINLKMFFEADTKAKITNYALFKVVDKIKQIDPVCLFPPFPHSNNANLTMIFKNDIVSNAEMYIEQPDTNISLISLAYNFGLPKQINRLWELIHDVDEYKINLTKKRKKC